MRIHYLQHEPFEDPGTILLWATLHAHSVTSTMVWKNEQLPPENSFDMLVIMGGAMSVYEDARYAWLVPEKKFIERAIRQGKEVLGVCLGAQLIASALTAEVYPNAYKEIGWFPVTLTPEGEKSALLDGWPNTFEAFHWHGDTFDLPEGAKKLAESEACANQAFSYGDRTVALQFHVESTVERVNRLVSSCGSDLALGGPWVQTARAILNNTAPLPLLPTLLFPLLDKLAIQ